MQSLTVGVLALHGDVSEHIQATKSAGAHLKIPVIVVPVRTAGDLETLDALIIPGGESTTLQKLCEREGMFQKMKKVKNVFGTCAGAILLAKGVLHASEGQKTLGLMNIEVDRNAYGRQNESFEKVIDTEFGSMNAFFIRAPKIRTVGKKLKMLARNGNEIVACEERVRDRYYLATCFHPEYNSNAFHGHFLKQILLGK